MGVANAEKRSYDAVFQTSLNNMKKLQSNVIRVNRQFSISSSWSALVDRLFQPADPSSLAVARILFGLLMFLDIPEERQLAYADVRWSNRDECRFPLYNSLMPPDLEWVCMAYFVMWMGSLGIMFGALYKLSCLAFAVPYWYIFLLDKTAWNNHSYLYGLLSVLFFTCDAHHIWSLDAYLGLVKSNTNVPFWNYAILRFQQFILYFYAGLKKIDFDWLSGQSQTGLSSHFMFSPFRYFLSENNIDLWIIHVGGYLLDLTAGFLLIGDKSRPAAFVFLAIFHIINSQAFHIGMFPYVCLAIMPLFCRTDWPKRLGPSGWAWEKTSKHIECSYPKKQSKNKLINEPPKKYRTISFLAFYAAIQVILPYSHFITKGYNNWTNGLYGYSWDMMVHSWDTSRVTVELINKENGDVMYLDPKAWVKTDKWQRHADMAVQYAHCLRNRILSRGTSLSNFSIHLDTLVSLNHRFMQRIFDPKVDLLSFDWSPFHAVPWVMPLMSQFSDWRQKILSIEREVHSWSNQSNVLFIADFPGYYIENFIEQNIRNVSLTVLEGTVNVQIGGEHHEILMPGSTLKIPSMTFHKVQTSSSSPSCYFYVFYSQKNDRTPILKSKDRIHFFESGKENLQNMAKSWSLIRESLFKILNKFLSKYYNFNAQQKENGPYLPLNS